MTQDWPRIKARRTTRTSPWMAIIEREVEFAPEAEIELYHAVGQQDYIAIVAALPDSRLPIVQQYRPALESFTWELPAGLLDPPGEDAAACCRRELMEETGFTARAVRALGCYAPCTARMSNQVHSFYVEIDPRIEGKPTEAGIEFKLVSPAQLAELILAEDVLQLHIGAIRIPTEPRSATPPSRAPDSGAQAAPGHRGGTAPILLGPIYGRAGQPGSPPHPASNC